MKVISVLNQKGGAGKSTIAINVAVGFAREGKKVLLIDTDNQRSCLYWYSNRDEEPEVKVESIPISGALRKAIPEHKKNYDVIIIDGVPSEDKMTTASIDVSDFILIPFQPSAMDYWSTETLAERVMGSDKNAAYLLSRFPTSRTRLSEEIYTLIKEQELPLLETRIRNRVSYADSISNSTTIWNWDDKKAFEEVEGLMTEIKAALYE